MPNLNGLVEAALFVADLPRARDFYQQVVGLDKLQESEAGCVFLIAKGQVLLLVTQQKARVPSKTPGGDVPACLVGAGESLGAGHIAFAVTEAEFDAWQGRLESKGVEVLSDAHFDQVLPRRARFRGRPDIAEVAWE